MWRCRYLSTVGQHPPFPKITHPLLRTAKTLHPLCNITAVPLQRYCNRTAAVLQPLCSKAQERLTWWKGKILTKYPFQIRPIFVISSFLRERTWNEHGTNLVRTCPEPFGGKKERGLKYRYAYKAKENKKK